MYVWSWYNVEATSSGSGGGGGNESISHTISTLGFTC